jgi:hypothetical protein
MSGDDSYLFLELEDLDFEGGSLHGTQVPGASDELIFTKHPARS